LTTLRDSCSKPCRHEFLSNLPDVTQYLLQPSLRPHVSRSSLMTQQDNIPSSSPATTQPPLVHRQLCFFRRAAIAVTSYGRLRAFTVHFIFLQSQLRPVCSSSREPAGTGEPAVYSKLLPIVATTGTTIKATHRMQHRSEQQLITVNSTRTRYQRMHDDTLIID